MKNLQVLLISFLISVASVLSYGEPSNKTLLIFGAKWCKFCATAKNDIQNDKILSQLVKDYNIVNVDNDDDQDIVKAHNVKTLPTFIVFKDGKELKRQNGYDGPKKLIKFLK